MSDIRFIMIGVVVITVGFIILGVYGTQFTEITIQTNEFKDCFEYPEDMPPIRISFDEKIQSKNMFFALVIGFLVAGGLSLLKGIIGKWDQDVKPEEMLGPGGDKKDNDSTKS